MAVVLLFGESVAQLCAKFLILNRTGREEPGSKFGKPTTLLSYGTSFFGPFSLHLWLTGLDNAGNCIEGHG